MAAHRIHRDAGAFVPLISSSLELPQIAPDTAEVGTLAPDRHLDLALDVFCFWASTFTALEFTGILPSPLCHRLAKVGWLVPKFSTGLEALVAPCVKTVVTATLPTVLTTSYQVRPYVCAQVPSAAGKTRTHRASAPKSTARMIQHPGTMAGPMA